MYLVFGIAVASVAAVAYAWLSNEEQSAINSYHSSSRRLTREVAERQGQLNSYKQTNRATQDFYRHIELHYNSVITANDCYKFYDVQKQMLTMLSSRIEILIKQIIELKKQRDEAIGSVKVQIREQLNSVRESLNQAKHERSNIKQQKVTLLSELRDINHKTRELKLYLRDHCGQKGRDWYQRRLERRSA